MALNLIPARNPGRSGRIEQWRPRSQTDRNRTLQELARAHTEEAVKTLVVAMRYKGPQQVPAAIALLDRGWGRPAQRLEGDGASHLHLHLLAAQLVQPMLEAQPEPERQAQQIDGVPTE